MEAGLCEVVYVEEFASHVSGAPYGDTGTSVLFGFMESTNESRNDVRIFGVVVVAWPIKVGGHRRMEEDAVLIPVSLAEFEAGDFGDGVGFVGGLERAREEAFLRHGLWGFARVDAGTAEEEEP